MALELLLHGEIKLIFLSIIKYSSCKLYRGRGFNVNCPLEYKIEFKHFVQQ
jgi:hypothetical protein